MEVLRSHPPRFFEENLESMVALARHRGIDVLLTSWAHSPNFDDYASTNAYETGFREHNEISRRVAERNGVPFFDFAAEMPTEVEFWADGRHNTEAGAARKAELFAAFVHDRFLSD
jgi:hypothetical protein